MSDPANRILAIDPGTTQSGYVQLTRSGEVTAHGILENEELLEALKAWNNPHLIEDIAIEMIASQGMAVGAETFETCVWIGRFLQMWEDGGTSRRSPGRRILRREVKLTICGNTRAKDANVRQALIDRYGPTKEIAVGRKKTPGPLYGIRSHEWAALAVGVTYLERSHPGWRPSGTTAPQEPRVGD